MSDFCVVGHANYRDITVLWASEVKETMCESSTSFELLNVNSLAYDCASYGEREKENVSCVLWHWLVLDN